MKRLLLNGHTGLGDHLLCNGLVRVLVERGNQVIIPCKQHNEMSVAAMFADLYPRVITESHAEDGRPADEVLNLGYYAAEHETDTFDESRFDAEFYRQAGVPFLAKWEKFETPTIAGGLRSKRFVHDDPSRGFIINLEGTRPDATKPSPITDYVEMLILAEEIHCINSSFAILADLINAPGKKFLHKYARPDGGALPIFGRAWTVLDKPL